LSIRRFLVRRVSEGGRAGRTGEAHKRFMDLHRIHWPAFEGESEVRPLEAEVQQQK
jgi:hypothetical protein